MHTCAIFSVVQIDKFLPGLKLVSHTLMVGSRSIRDVFFLLMCSLFLMGILGCSLFSGNDPEHFGGLHRAMFSLFVALTNGGW
jgi:voltage-gated sodium channel